jgi:hypothetical protein
MYVGNGGAGTGGGGDGVVGVGGADVGGGAGVAIDEAGIDGGVGFAHMHICSQLTGRPRNCDCHRMSAYIGALTTRICTSYIVLVLGGMGEHCLCIERSLICVVAFCALWSSNALTGLPGRYSFLQSQGG